MALVSQPISLSSYSYSCDSTKGLSKRAARLDAMSWADFDRCMRAGMTYEQVNAVNPMPRREYDKRVKEGHYQPEYIRKHEQKVEKICKMYDNGASIQAIADANKISLKYCKRILNDNGRSTNEFAMFMAQNRAKIMEMAEKNFTVKGMARKLHVKPDYMADALVVMKVQTKKERLAEFADDLTKSKLTALLKKYGGLKNTSKATGLSINKIKECAKILNVVI